jgi:Arc/MetJ family transcription regulator
MKCTSIVIDEKLIKAGLKVTGLRTHSALVDFALRDLHRRESPQRLFELKGKVHWKDGLFELRTETS